MKEASTGGAPHPAVEPPMHYAVLMHVHTSGQTHALVTRSVYPLVARLYLLFPHLSPCAMSTSGSTPTTVTPPTLDSAGTGTVTLSEGDLTTLIQTAVRWELAAISSASSSSVSPPLLPAPIPSTATTGMPMFPFCCGCTAHAIPHSMLNAQSSSHYHMTNPDPQRGILVDRLLC